MVFWIALSLDAARPVGARRTALLEDWKVEWGRPDRTRLALWRHGASKFIGRGMRPKGPRDTKQINSVITGLVVLLSRTPGISSRAEDDQRNRSSSGLLSNPLSILGIPWSDNKESRYLVYKSTSSKSISVSEGR
jgi:hypothetical protein